jgi:hypothetical protein
LKAAFIAAQNDAKSSFLHVRIVDDKFSLVGKTAASSGNDSDDFVGVQNVCDAKKASFFVKRAPVVKQLQEAENKWVLIFYMPELTMVRDKMLFASSSSALKDGLGGSNFVEDLHISTKEEATFGEFKQSRKQEATDEMLSLDELTAKEAEFASAMASSVASESLVRSEAANAFDVYSCSLRRLCGGIVGGGIGVTGE